MKLYITIFQDEDGWFVVECPSIPGCVSQGKTKQGAISNIREAIELCIEERKKHGLPITIDTMELAVPSHA